MEINCYKQKYDLDNSECIFFIAKIQMIIIFALVKLFIWCMRYLKSKKYTKISIVFFFTIFRKIAKFYFSHKNSIWFGGWKCNLKKKDRWIKKRIISYWRIKINERKCPFWLKANWIMWEKEKEVIWIEHGSVIMVFGEPNTYFFRVFFL